MDDVKVSLRLLAKSPGFTLAAILVLALGIGLNAAMFAMVHALAIAGRPFAQPDRLVQLYSRDTRTTRDYRAFSFPVYEELAANETLFTGVLAHTPTIVAVGDGGVSRRTFAALVSANFFSVLGVTPAHGRGFTSEENRPEQDIPVVIATYSYWKRTGFDPTLVGQTLRINERHFTVVGITPRGFTGTMTVFGPELFLPLGVFHSVSDDFRGQDSRTLTRADAYNLFLVGRLRDGVSMETANGGLTPVAASLAERFPAEHRDQALSVGSLPRFGTSTSPSDERVLAALGAMLLGMTGAVLLTVCLNLASMLLARGRGRRKEFAIRLALGGGRGRIIRQLLVEGALLSFVGGALGIVFGLYGIDALIASMSTILPMAIALESTVSVAIAGATAFFSVAATIGFALGPALKHSRADVLDDLKTQPGDDPAPRRWRVLPRNPLVAAQVALSLCLLIAAGLFLRMAIDAASVDIGFDADETIVAEVDGRLGGLDAAQSLALYRRMEDRLSALPGVGASSIGALIPLGLVNISKEVRRAGVAPSQEARPGTAEAGREFGTPWNAVGARYFDAMGIRLLQGRPFTGAESLNEGAPPVVILDEVTARKLWPDGSALGQRIVFARNETEKVGAVETPMAVVGIVSATRPELFEREPRGAVYVPFAQGFMSNVFFHVRPEGRGDGLVEAVRQTIRAEAADLPLFGVRTFRTHLDGSAEYWALTMSMSMFGFFGGLAMIVALVGIYGVTSYAVARRTREIGIRMAVGARPAAVVRLILGESLATTTAGIAIGWLLGLGIGRMMASLFVDVAAFDPWTFALVPVGFVVAAVLATWLPARRATEVNPVTALRAE